MELGMSTACFYPLETEWSMERIAAAGFRKCEVFLEAEYEYSGYFICRLQEELTRYSIGVLSMHPFGGLFEPLLFSEYERRRKDAIFTFRKALSAAQALGAQCYNLHGDKNLLPINQVDFSWYGKIISELADLAEDYGIVLSWENVVRNSSKDPEFIRRTREYVTSRNLGFTFDYKQARRAGIAPERYFEVMDGQLTNVHISDYNATETCLAPGDGIMNFPLEIDRLRALNYNGPVIVELYSDSICKKKNLGEIYKILSHIVF